MDKSNTIYKLARCVCFVIGLLLGLFHPPCVRASAVKGLYVGKDFYAPDTATQKAARVSGFNRLFLSFLHIDSNGNMAYNGTPIVQNGVYIGDPSWGPSLAALKLQPTGIERIEIVIAGGDDPSFSNIRSLLASQGTWTNSILYKDILALKNAIGVDAIQYDESQTCDVSSAVEFGKLITGLGLKLSLRPQRRKLWVDVKAQLETNVDAIYLQCYDRGASNDPVSWVKNFDGFKVYPGLWGNTDTPTSVTAKMRHWQQLLGINGGFMWLNGTMPNDSAKWADALSYGLDPISCLRIVNKGSGKALNLVDGSLTNGSAIEQLSCALDNNQRWMLLPTENGEHFKIVSWVSGQCASIATDSSLAGAQVWNWDYNSDPSQQFDLIDAGNGWFKIKNVRSGLFLEVVGGSLANKAPVQQNVDTGSPGQQWKLYPFGDDVLAQDNFDYPDGNLAVQNGGEGWSGAWQDDLGSKTIVDAGDLVGGTNVPSDYDARSSGNSAYVPTYQRVGRYLDCSVNGVFSAHGYLDKNGRIGADGTTLYISFLQKPTSTLLFYEFELNRGNRRIAGIGNDLPLDNINLRAPADRFTSLGHGDTNVNYYIMRIDFKEGNDDVLVYRNPTSTVEPETPTLEKLGVSDMSFDRISLAAFANNSVRHDQIRIATSWKYALGDAPGYSVQSSSNIVSDDLFRRIRISAQVLHGNGHLYHLKDGKYDVRAQLSRPVILEPGDMVDVVGLVQRVGQPVRLIEAVARKTGHSPMPQPHKIDSLDSKYESSWVTLEGTLVDTKENGGELVLVTQVGLKNLDARLLVNDWPPKTWNTGSRLKLTGVLLPKDNSPRDGNEEGDYELLLNSPADIKVLAQPLWWTLKRLLIIVAMLGIGLALAFLWIRSLKRQVEQRTIQLKREISKREQVEYEHIIAEERSRISRDLHDDLGSRLTQICMLACLMPGAKTSPELAFERLHLIADKSRSMVTSLDEVVWMLNPKNETLSSFAAYLAAYTEEFLSKMDITCRVEAPESYPSKVITAETRNHLFASVKEAINNAVRHGHPSKLLLKLTVSEDNFTIEVHDNGCGFDPASASGGNGLGNFQEHMLKLNGDCRIESSKQNGTKVTLAMPWPTEKMDVGQGAPMHSD